MVGLRSPDASRGNRSGRGNCTGGEWPAVLSTRLPPAPSLTLRAVRMEGAQGNGNEFGAQIAPEWR